MRYFAVTIGLILANISSVHFGISDWPRCIERSFFQLIAIFAFSIVSLGSKE